MSFQILKVLFGSLLIAFCHGLQQSYSSGGPVETISFLPTGFGLVMHPSNSRYYKNESYEEFSFVALRDAYGIEASYGSFMDIAHFPSRDVLPSLNSQTNFYNKHSEVSAHLIQDRVTLDFPVIQVMFQIPSTSLNDLNQLPVCVMLRVTREDEVLWGFCLFIGSTRACLSNVTIPESWWLEGNYTAEVSYVALTEFEACSTNSFRSLSGSAQSSAKSFQNDESFTVLGKVIVESTFDYNYEVINKNSEIFVYSPKSPISPGYPFGIFVRLRPKSPLKKFIMRAKTKPGLVIQNVKAHQPFQTHVKITGKRHYGEVHVSKIGDEKIERMHPVLDWVLEVEPGDLSTNKNSLKVIFSLEYSDSVEEKGNESQFTGRIRLADSLVVKLLPFLEVREIINVAPLTGKVQSYDMSLYAVTKGGLFTDVTEQCQCKSSDENILQVSHSCKSFLTQGREARGSTAVAIKFQYGGQEVVSMVTVWVLETPLSVELSDSKLSLMAGWKVPLLDRGIFSNSKSLKSSSLDVPLSCHVKFQLSTVDLFARLVAYETVTSSPTKLPAASSSGTFRNVSNGARSKSTESHANQNIQSLPVKYFLHRKPSFKVTHLLKHLVRSADSNVVKLNVSRKDGILVAEGMSPGKTEIQVFSHRGKMVGSADIRVALDKVTLYSLKGSAVSDLQMEVSPSSDFPGAMVAKIHKIGNMDKRQQEASLELSINFDDNTNLPLKLIHPDDYVLTIESLDDSVVEVARTNSNSPKLIARSSGFGDLVSLALNPSRHCAVPRPRPLATGHVRVNVDITQDGFLTQNDGGHFFGNSAKDIIELDVETVKKNHKFERSRPRTSKFDGSFGYVEGSSSKSNHMRESSNAKSDTNQNAHMETYKQQIESSSPSNALQVTLYILLAIFGLAMAIFVVNCFLYVTGCNGKSKMPYIFAAKSATIKEVQDWVWIDKKTLERNSVNTKCTRALMSPDEFSRASKASSSSSNAGCRLSSATDFSSEVSCISSSGGVKAGGTYRGSECSIRIGVPPPSIPPDDNGNTLLHDDVKCGRGGCGQVKNFKDCKSALIEQLQTDSDVEMAESFRCMEGKTQPAKSLHHLLSTKTPDPLEWNEEEMGMSYEELMKYFDSLKESTA